MSTTRSLSIFAILCAAAGIALRVACARNAFWLDEIWSYLLVNVTAPSVRGIFFDLSHDNNHILNSLFLLFFGEQADWFWYRLPSLLFGSAAILLCFFAAGRGRGEEEKSARPIAAALCALSFAMILYSSEARGYAGACFFGLAAFLCFEGLRKKRSRALYPLFWALCILGFLAQLTFAHVYLSLLLWSLWLLRKEVDKRREILRLVALHLPVLVFVLFIYLALVKGMKVGGGPVFSAPIVLGQALSVAVGGGKNGWPALFSALAGLALAAACLRFFRRLRDERFFFYAMVLAAAPLAVLIMARPGRLYFRYFVVCFPFFYLALARVMASLLGGRRREKLLALGLAAALLLSNGLLIARFLDAGRGGYPEAIRFMAANTAGPSITVGSDDDYMGPKMLMFYARLLPPGKEMLYAPEEAIPQAPPLWFLLQPQDPDEKARSMIALPGGARYILMRSYPYSGFSGISWYLYRRLPGPIGH